MFGEHLVLLGLFLSAKARSSESTLPWSVTSEDRTSLSQMTFGTKSRHVGRFRRHGSPAGLEISCPSIGTNPPNHASNSTR
jgi:hypothetical protein